jgi:hypothetical protein
MTDRELLEAAAKAAGKTDFRYIERGFVGGSPLPQELWNPLHNDGDALRLAVRMKLTINPYQEGVFVSRYEGEEVVAETFEVIGVPDCAATRRAIVRAAAAMVPE